MRMFGRPYEKPQAMSRNGQATGRIRLSSPKKSRPDRRAAKEPSMGAMPTESTYQPAPQYSDWPSHAWNPIEQMRASAAGSSESSSSLAPK